jgi:hypothetical protein
MTPDFSRGKCESRKKREEPEKRKRRRSEIAARLTTPPNAILLGRLGLAGAADVRFRDSPVKAF